MDKLMHDTDCIGDGAEHNVNEDDTQQEALLKQLHAMDVADEATITVVPAWPQCLYNVWKRLPLKAALSHAVLLFSLSMYCAFGGLVRVINVNLNKQ